MLRKIVYSRIENLLNRIARFLAQRGFTPNQLTLAGLGLNLAAAGFYALGVFLLGGLTLLTAGLGDLLDGPLARVTGKSSRFGAFLDSTVDRYSDFFIFGGIAFYYAAERAWGWLLVSLGILLGSSVTSYAKARGENLVPAVTAGWFERSERILLLALGSFVPPLLPWVLGILLVGTHATALQRIWFVRKALQG